MNKEKLCKVNEIYCIMYIAGMLGSFFIQKGVGKLGRRQNLYYCFGNDSFRQNMSPIFRLAWRHTSYPYAYCLQCVLYYVYILLLR